jgi:N-formylglutamate deformylase
MSPRNFPTHALRAGSSPLIISVPHAGMALPPEMSGQLTPLARMLPDTDWHVPQLYDFARELGATMIVARYSRYVIDLNRPPDDTELYSDSAKTGLCPVVSFAGEALYLQGPGPLAPHEIERRRQRYWQPYHDALQEQVNATRARHGHALLVDAHSIRSVVPRLFDGRLPDVNIGTHDARSCDPALTGALRARLGTQAAYTCVIDGRFKGGYITRNYGRPDSGAHALQIELAQSAYLQEPDAGSQAKPAYDAARAAPLRALLHVLLTDLLSVPLAGI